MRVGKDADPQHQGGKIMRINTNLTAMNTYTQYTKNNNKIASSVSKLSSGYAINSASDNAAGLAISEKMRAQIRGLDQASTNAQDAISLTQTAEGALSSSTEILQRMREIAVQSSNDTNGDNIDREALQDEFSQLQAELDDISKTTSFNKKNLLDGSLAKNTAVTTNEKLQKPSLSVELGKASAGSYAFSVGVKQESAAIDGVKSSFTAISNDTTSFTVSAVTNNLGASSMANGNYDITATYSESNHDITFTAKGDNGQTFTATLSQADLRKGVSGDTTLGAGTANTTAAMTLNFKNSDNSGTAFSFTVQAGQTYDTENASTMSSLANKLTSALSLSASKGVDQQDATYGLYAKLTGAEDVKLSSGMDSVSFSNGVKVSFDQLTATDVDTANQATLDSGTVPAGAGASQSATSGAYSVKYNNFKMADTSNVTFSDDAKLTKITATDKKTFTATIDGKAYTATLAKDAEGFATTDAVGATKSYALNFKDTAGNDAFSMSMDMELTDLNTKATPDGEAAFTKEAATSATLAIAINGNGGHISDKVFGTAGAASTFSVENKAGAGLTFQVGANEGDELVINVDKLDSNYLGVASASVSSQELASSAITSVDNAINQVSSQRAYMGAIQNRLDYKISNLDTTNENLTSAESEIRDVDMAKEMTNFTNANILSQAATAMLAQANSLPQNVLSLLG
jgi:flagellin